MVNVKIFFSVVAVTSFFEGIVCVSNYLLYWPFKGFSDINSEIACNEVHLPF